MVFETNEHHVHILICMYSYSSQNLTIYQVSWVNGTMKSRTIAGGRQHGFQACAVPFLPILVKQRSENELSWNILLLLRHALPQPAGIPSRKEGGPINCRPTAKVEEGRKKKPTLGVTTFVASTARTNDLYTCSFNLMFTIILGYTITFNV